MPLGQRVEGGHYELAQRLGRLMAALAVHRKDRPHILEVADLRRRRRSRRFIRRQRARRATHNSSNRKSLAAKQSDHLSIPR
jgi:hypothetical protein